MFGNLFGSKPKDPENPQTPMQSGQMPPTPPDGTQPDTQIVPQTPGQPMPVSQPGGMPGMPNQPQGSPLQNPQSQSGESGQPGIPSQNQPGEPGGATPPSSQDATNGANGVIGSRMDPAFRQNLSALSHLDQRTTQVLLHASEETKRVHQQLIEPDQILIGLLYDEGVFKLLEDFAIDVAALLREIQSKEAAGSFTGQPMLSNDSQQLFEKAYLEAKKRDAAFITPEDVIMTILSANNKATGFLNGHGLKKEKLEEKLTKSTEYNYGKKSVLDKFGIDLTDEARQGKLDPIAGRDKEIERMIHILLRRTKNNPVIIGEAGVGKTAIVEGLAEAIAGGTVPDSLKNRRIIQLDMASLVAGASHRGEFEERLRGVINEAMASNGQLILFIDEVHTVMGAGEEGTMDAANIIKPNLARGKLQIIGATTTSEYRKHFEKDKAFERRFQPITVDEPDEENAIKMLQVLRPKFEKFHQVVITDEALESAVKLSKKYIGERYLPDKAVDLLDEASAEVKLAHSEGKGMSYTTQNKEDTFKDRLAKTKDTGKAEVIDANGNVIEDSAKQNSDGKDASAASNAASAGSGQVSSTDSTKDGSTDTKNAQQAGTQDPNKPADGIPADPNNPLANQQNAAATPGQPGVPGQMASTPDANGMTAPMQNGQQISMPNPFGQNGMQPGTQPGQPYQAYSVPGSQPNGMAQGPAQPGQPVQPGQQAAMEASVQGANPTQSGMANPAANGQPGAVSNPSADGQKEQTAAGTSPDGTQPGQDSNNPQAKDGQAVDPNAQNQAVTDPNNPNAVQDSTKSGEKTPEELAKTHAEGVKGPEVTKSDIENVVSNWTGIPITKLTEDEGQKLLKLEDRIHQRLIDQEEAVKAVSEAVRRGRIGLASGNRPIASFIFLGPTGTGKTELAKTLAEILFGRDDAMVRLDMSEYMEKHEVAKLIGAPPGYVGYEEGGQLTEAVRAKPYSIVLLDEVEKAHPDVFNILLQLLEDGRLTDNKGNTISFKNTIVICTSNIGSATITQSLSDKNQKIQKTKEQEEKEFKELSDQVNEELRKFFRPELLNRYDDIVIFKPLRRQDMSKIAKLGIDKTAKLLKEQGYAVQVTEKGLAQMAVEGYDPVYGARPLRRLIQTSIENPIALALISKQFASGDTIVIDYDEKASKYVFRQGVKKTEDKDKDASKGSEDVAATSEAGMAPGVSAPENPIQEGKPGEPGKPGQPPGATDVQYPDWVKQALNQNGQPGTPDANNPQQPGGAGMAQSLEAGSGTNGQMPGAGPAQQAAPQPSLVDQIAQPAVEAPFDPLALVGSTPPSQPTNGMNTPSSDGTAMQKAN